MGVEVGRGPQVGGVKVSLAHLEDVRDVLGTGGYVEVLDLGQVGESALVKGVQVGAPGKGGDGLADDLVFSEQDDAGSLCDVQVNHNVTMTSLVIWVSLAMPSVIRYLEACRSLHLVSVVMRQLG